MIETKEKQTFTIEELISQLEPQPRVNQPQTLSSSPVPASLPDVSATKEIRVSDLAPSLASWKERFDVSAEGNLAEKTSRLEQLLQRNHGMYEILKKELERLERIGDDNPNLLKAIDNLEAYIEHYDRVKTRLKLMKLRNTFTGPLKKILGQK